MLLSGDFVKTDEGFDCRLWVVSPRGRWARGVGGWRVTSFPGFSLRDWEGEKLWEWERGWGKVSVNSASVLRLVETPALNLTIVL